MKNRDRVALLFSCVQAEIQTEHSFASLVDEEKTLFPTGLIFRYDSFCIRTGENEKFFSFPSAASASRSLPHRLGHKPIF